MIRVIVTWSIVAAIAVASIAVALHDAQAGLMPVWATAVWLVLDSCAIIVCAAIIHDELTKPRTRK